MGGGLQVHNHATTWPNLQDGTSKNSIQIEFQVGPQCGNNLKQPSMSLFLTAKKPVMTAGGDDTFSKQGDTISNNSAGQLADRRCVPGHGAGMERFRDSEDEMTA